MENLKGKKLLVLGGLALECEIVTRAQEMGIYVIVADYNPNVPARKYADRFELISATDVPALVELCKKEIGCSVWYQMAYWEKVFKLKLSPFKNVP